MDTVSVENKHPALRMLLMWGLGTFHTTFFLTSVVLVLYSAGILGDLLGSLNTALGFAAFAVFWSITVWCTGRLLRGYATHHADRQPQQDPALPADILRALEEPVDFGSALLLGLYWGGINGVLFFLAVLAAITVAIFTNILRGSAPADSLLFLLVVAVVGSAVAFLTGALVGLFFALCDIAFVEITRYTVVRFVSQEGEES